MPTHEKPTALDAVIASPFVRLAELLAGSEPGAKPIDLSLGEPRAMIPAFLGPILQERLGEFGRYPPIRGVQPLREAISGWIGRRYPSLAGQVSPEYHVLPLTGSREGLFSAIFPALARKDCAGKPAVLIPNPFYQAYAAAAAAAGAEAVYLPARSEEGFLPDLEGLGAEVLRRTAALYLCSPSNPQGAVAGRDYLGTAIELARHLDFLVFADECYSEIYSSTPPPGALEVAQASQGNFANVLAFNSLSKRSGLPGLRSGFIAGDPEFIAAFSRFRNVACPQMPLPIQHVSVAAWGDEAHVEQGRARYRENFDIADEILGSRYGHRRPAGAFFLWLDMSQFGGGEAAAKTLWQGTGVKVLPGTYLARVEPDGSNPGKDHVRIALVGDAPTMREALTRIVSTLG